MSEILNSHCDDSFDSPRKPNIYNNRDSNLREEDLFQRNSRLRGDEGSRVSSTFNSAWNPSAVKDYSADVPAPPPSLRYVSAPPPSLRYVPAPPPSLRYVPAPPPSIRYVPAPPPSLRHVPAPPSCSS